MSNEATSTDLRLTVEVERGAGVVQRVSVHVEGQGDLALQTAARIAEIYERAAADLLRSPVSATSSAPPASREKQSTEASGGVVAAAEPVSAPIVERRPAAMQPTEASERSAAATSPERPPPWFRRHRVRISGGVGVVMFLLAVGVPLLVPVEMRREILPMPIAFGLVGALSLFSALLPEPDGKPRAAMAAMAAAPVAPAASTLRAGQRRAAPVSAGRRTVGAGFGALFALGGLIAPFVLASANPDDRFLMMIGFAPIAAIGAFLMWVFLRQTPALQGEGAAAHRVRSSSSSLSTTPESIPTSSVRDAPSPSRDAKLTSARSASESSKDDKMTSALMALAVMLAVIVLLVAAATVLQMAG